MKLIVLDINGVLLDRARHKKTFTKKPGLDEFLVYLFENFKVAVWTAAKQKNANIFIKAIFTELQQSQLLFIWTQSECERVEKNPGKDYPLFYKNLSRTWKHFPDYHIDNTIIADDTHDKLKNNPVKTIIVPKNLEHLKYCLLTINSISQIEEP